MMEFKQSTANGLLDLYIKFFEARSYASRRSPRIRPETIETSVRRAGQILKQIDQELKNQTDVVKKTLGNANRLEIHLFMAAVYAKLTGNLGNRFGLPTGRDIISLLVEPKYIPSLIPMLMPESRLVSEGIIVSPDAESEASVLDAHWNIPDSVLMRICGLNNIKVQTAGERTEKEIVRYGVYELREKPRLTLDDVVLNEKARLSVQSAITQHLQGDRIFEDFGLGDSIKYGRGCTMLLYGPPGTGKTMLAEGIAGSLGRPLVAADYPGILSKWYGESQKNVSLLFRAAQSRGAVLLIDEADAICGERISGPDTSTAKGMNQELLVLCSELEKYNGVVILTTNMAAALDPALDRRLMLKLELPIPSAEERVLLWRKHIGSKLPIAKDVNVNTLSQKFEISGGLIKNAVISAAARALARDQSKPLVCMDDFIQAASAQKADYREASSGRRLGLLSHVV